MEVRSAVQADQFLSEPFFQRWHCAVMLNANFPRCKSEAVCPLRHADRV